MYYRGAIGAFVVFDVTDSRSYENIPGWVKQIQSEVPSVELVLVGNKLDRPDRVVSKEQGIALGQDHNLPYIETSALTGESRGVPVSRADVNEAFQLLFSNVVFSAIVEEVEPLPNEYVAKPGDRSCCHS